MAFRAQTIPSTAEFSVSNECALCHSGKPRLRSWTWRASAACLLLALAAPQSVWAQEADEAEPADEAPASAPAGTDNSLPPEDSPLVGEPRNPGELMEAALLMIE